MVYIDLRYTPQIEVEDEDGNTMQDLSLNNVRDVIDFMLKYLTHIVQKDKWDKTGIHHKKWKVCDPYHADNLTDDGFWLAWSEYVDRPKWICNYELYNKFGERTHLHYHMNFYIPDHKFNRPVKKDSLAKQLNRTLGLKGNKMYCLRVHHDIPENVDRWWRYCLKQNTLPPLAHDCEWCDGFEQEEIDSMHVLAADEYEQRKIENCAARQKMADKNNFRYKLVKHFKKKADDRQASGGARLDDKQLWCAIASYYMEHNMTPPFGKMDDVLIDLKVEIGYLDIHDYYDLTH